MSANAEKLLLLYRLSVSGPLDISRVTCTRPARPTGVNAILR